MTIDLLPYEVYFQVGGVSSHLIQPTPERRGGVTVYESHSHLH